MVKIVESRPSTRERAIDTVQLLTTTARATAAAVGAIGLVLTLALWSHTSGQTDLDGHADHDRVGWGFAVLGGTIVVVIALLLLAVVEARRGSAG